ncbi:hypothetical protein C4559_06115 [Candidatus Microgenomates bacterium]|nr:MAG: hypothetical protein C4559_06115 [Candidatus Microgenomates bacterium]
MKKQKGEIAVLLAIIIFAVGLFIFTIPKSDNNSETECLIGERPSEPFPERQLPSIRNFSEGNGEDRTLWADGGPDIGTSRPFVLVRAKVPFDPRNGDVESLFPNRRAPDGKPTGTSHFVSYGIQDLDGVKFEIYYPNVYGEITLDQDHVFAYKRDDDKNADLQFHQEGFLFFLRLNADGQPETVAGVDRQTGAQATFWLTDIYQEKTRYEASLTGERGYTYEDVFRCQNGSQTTQKGVFPTGTSEDKKQLQLNTFRVTFSSDFGFSAHCKPAIYLYPEEKTKVNVKVNTKGFFTYTDPLYPQNGWDATAYPDGKIIVGNKNYEYLYYESKIPDNLIEKPKTGFVVKFIDLPSLFSDVLPKLGLSPKQTLDFKTYWEKNLPYSPYYFVGVMNEKNIDDFEPLIISPKPATIIRVRLYFEAIKQDLEIQKPEILTPQKKGFSVVEWGGMIKTDKEHPFTCSQ